MTSIINIHIIILLSLLLCTTAIITFTYCYNYIIVTFTTAITTTTLHYHYIHYCYPYYYCMSCEWTNGQMHSFWSMTRWSFSSCVCHVFRCSTTKSNIVCAFRVYPTRHVLPPSEIDLGLCLAVFSGSEGRYLFHRIGRKGRIWQP